MRRDQFLCEFTAFVGLMFVVKLPVMNGINLRVW